MIKAITTHNIFSNQRKTFSNQHKTNIATTETQAPTPHRRIKHKTLSEKRNQLSNAKNTIWATFQISDIYLSDKEPLLYQKTEETPLPPTHVLNQFPRHTSDSLPFNLQRDYKVIILG